ncbi:Ser/Thr protein kinase RdoA involved in Cpx stress response, MazF antagonist [Pustulibacterium marinum]|uniref:Ser/Thr protein kinase RdoA involved in Cpx stress response, MazF antagonist n=1 Tax=Pustulibacterium marinum TaxID=1224947 RepID=A0A1I7I3Q1_9FLAO|nr:phosphotransferase [Pustulibacterium marinum]SFU67537.1 Ser/Thr protein kinase RdoA involved in Cpx stress response, MazF antagonist [Pustulibacterium marinum]
MTTFPVSNSTLSEKELGEFIKDTYNLSRSFECKLFRTGMNHTYFISNAERKFVVRVYCYNWRTKAEIQEELVLLELLRKNNLSVSYPISDKENNQIQEINAPEGLRYVVLFSFAKGEKMRFMDQDTCFEIGSLMAKIHNLTSDKIINRIFYDKKSLVEQPYEYLSQFFSDNLPEMEFIKKFGEDFSDSDFDQAQNGILHMDIWYDNMAIADEKEITIFDFDFCGNGKLILDVAYFCKQLFFIELDKEKYESKVESFLSGYSKNRSLSKRELDLIPKAGASVFIFYLGIQAQRFDWSNIFLTENYLKMFVGRIKSWLQYYEEK